MPNLRSFLSCLFLFLLLPLNSLSASDLSSSESLQQEILNAARVAPHEGERCLVSGQEIPHDAEVRIFRGRRFPLMPGAALEADLMKSPGKYLSLIQPRGALFAEGAERPKRNYAWIYFGALVILLLLLAGASAASAMRRGLDPRTWFYQALCGNIFAPFLAASKGTEEVTLLPGHTKPLRTAAPRLCASCGGHNHPAAGKCSMCSHTLEPEYQSEVERVNLTEENA